MDVVIITEVITNSLTLTYNKRLCHYICVLCSLALIILEALEIKLAHTLSLSKTFFLYSEHRLSWSWMHSLKCALLHPAKPCPVFKES